MLFIKWVTFIDISNDYLIYCHAMNRIESNRVIYLLFNNNNNNNNNNYHLHNRWCPMRPSLSPKKKCRVGRLLERAKESGRSDDTIEVIRRRFKTHVESCVPILESMKASGTVVHTIDSAKSVQQVYDSVVAFF